LRSRFSLPVHEVDERYTTTSAQAAQASDLDAEAAAIILEQFRRTRAADRWFYLNGANPYLAFSPAELARINETVAQSLASSYGITGVPDAFEATK